MSITPERGDVGRGAAGLPDTITAARASRLHRALLLNFYRQCCMRLADAGSWRNDRAASRAARILCDELTQRGKVDDVLRIEREAGR